MMINDEIMSNQLFSLCLISSRWREGAIHPSSISYKRYGLLHPDDNWKCSFMFSQSHTKDEHCNNCYIVLFFPRLQSS
jgi:hypothetical protein